MRHYRLNKHLKVLFLMSNRWHLFHIHVPSQFLLLLRIDNAVTVAVMYKWSIHVLSGGLPYIVSLMLQTTLQLASFHDFNVTYGGQNS